MVTIVYIFKICYCFLAFLAMVINCAADAGNKEIIWLQNRFWVSQCFQAL